MVDLRRRQVVTALAALMVSACVHRPYYGHAPAPRYYDYYYYPSVRVYFHYRSGYYYYPRHEKWIRSRTLPHHFNLHHHDRRVLRIAREHPYHLHHEHRKRYKPHPKYHPDPHWDRKEREHNHKKFEKHHSRKGRR